MGIEVAAFSAANVQSVNETGARWLRRNALLWSAVEPTEGAREWSAIASLEQELQTAAKRGLNVILIVRGTPGWAQRQAGVACGAIRDDKLAVFGAFMRDVAARYGKAPYNVRYLELWNEPDVDSSLVTPDSVYGCWGNRADPFYGGGAYAQMLKVVYPQVKAANARMRLLTGGLLLDCNPDQPLAGKDCQSGRFLEGILDAGGGPFFDIVSFHAYDFYQGSLGAYANGNWASTSASTGPVITAKARFIQAMLQRYNVGGKPLVNTESGLLCWGCGTPPADFETTKAHYVAQAYAVAKSERLLANVWYSLEGWFGTNLIDAAGQPLPAYTAFKVANANLNRANFVAQRNDAGAGVRVYEFTRGAQRLWVMWSVDGQPHEITLLGAPRQIVDALGQTIALSATQRTITVDAAPLYVQWQP